jgi:hypothetical protein
MACHFEAIKLFDFMKIEDLPIYPYIQLEDFGWDEVKDLPGAKEDELWEFEKLACTLAEKHFRRACKNLWPFLEHTGFKSISIGIDVIGIESSMAGYYHNFSDEGKGNYGFVLSYDILEQYLNYQLGNVKELRPVTKYMWEHELIHLLDHKNLTEFKFANRSTDVREFLVHYLLSYRNEGIADLYYFLNNGPDVKNLDRARGIFIEDISCFSAVEWEHYEIIKEKEWEMMQTYHFYSIGPWIILHILTCPEYKNSLPAAAEVITKLHRGESIENETILKIIKSALQISNEDFIECISKPGYDREAFFAGNELSRLADRLNKIKHPRVINENNDEYTGVNEDIITFYDRTWPEKSGHHL